MKDYKPLGNFGTYKSIFNGIGDYKNFKARDENGVLYQVGSVEISAKDGVVLSIYLEEPDKEEYT